MRLHRVLWLAIGIVLVGVSSVLAQEASIIGAVSDDARKLMDATREALNRAIAHCVPGNRLQDIGWAVQSYVEERGYSVKRLK